MGALTVFMMAIFMMSINILAVLANSQLKDDEIEAYLKRVNKPAVKSIVLKDGDIIDCVDIYKQPAFSHPRLKDHKIITPPSSLPKMASVANASRALPILHPFLQNGNECPEGTIPIRRTLKSDLVHVKSLDDYGRRNDVASWQMVERAGLIAQGRGFIGATGFFNVWGVWVEINEWSHTAVELSDDSQQSFVEGGWLVNPGLYGDNRTRIYAFWTADGYGTTGCYNLLCPGFVQTSKTVPLGAAIEPLSIFGGQQYEVTTIIIKYEKSDVWWLVFNSEYIGYWPVSIFVNHPLVDITTVKLIGSVLNTRNGGEHTSTQMGSGHFPGEGWGKAAFIRESQVMNSHEEGFHYPPSHWYYPFADKPKCYNALSNENLIFYGGPGLGADGCT